jgi:hypothetical protein
MRYALFLIAVLFLPACICYKQRKQYIRSIYDLTREGHCIYVTINCKNRTGNICKILISTRELHWLEYSNTSLDVDFPDTLRQILKTGYWSPNRGVLNNLSLYLVDTIDYQNVKKNFSPYNAYTKFFDEKTGIALRDYPPSKIETVLAYLIDNKVIVFQDDYSGYMSVGGPPDFRKKRCKNN